MLVGVLLEGVMLLVCRGYVRRGLTCRGYAPASSRPVPTRSRRGTPPDMDPCRGNPCPGAHKRRDGR
ncbi:hypothetical protein BD626DRAFT_511510 [Schizophyllum amplum]|uniref:Copper transporter n=1 Tax=Schizophyllum amplum TaxID=97359 RepID=A0A550C192_9AGAR|nr:hypothetical protein BD626DRAFT_511510 [Auriculariopsis ampla]